jgi:formyl-CoA transferase
MGGLRYLTGEPGRVPVRVGVSIGDSLAGLQGVIGVLLALYHRAANGGRGQVIDVALYESVFSVMESLLPEYSAFGVVREPAGSALPGIAPTNAYRCTDGWVLIAGNGDRIFQRLMRTIGREDLATEETLQSNTGRSAAAERLDAAIEAWTRSRSIADVLQVMDGANVPAGRMYTAQDIAKDPHYHIRDMIVSHETSDGELIDVPGIVPKLSETPGRIGRPAPRLGEHTTEVLTRLGIPEEVQERLRARGVIAGGA